MLIFRRFAIIGAAYDYFEKKNKEKYRQVLVKNV